MSAVERSIMQIGILDTMKTAARALIVRLRLQNIALTEEGSLTCYIPSRHCCCCCKDHTHNKSDTIIATASEVQREMRKGEAICA